MNKTMKCNGCNRIVHLDEDEYNFNYEIKCRECWDYFAQVEDESKDDETLMFGDKEHVKCYICGAESTDNYEDKPVCDSCFDELDEDNEPEDDEEEPEVKRIFGIPTSNSLSSEEQGVMHKKW